MKKSRSVKRAADPDMLPEYDFSKAVRGKYAGRIPKGLMVVSIDPDIAKVFPDAKAVNEALRALAGIIRRTKTV